MEQPNYAKFVDVHRAELIQRVHMVMPLADRLLSLHMLHNEAYAAILPLNSSRDQMRMLFLSLDSGGDKVKSAFCEALRDNNLYLYQELQEQGNAGELETQLASKSLLERLETSITKHLEPRVLLPHMSGCFSQTEEKEIKEVEEARGPIAASEIMIECLMRSDKPQWFTVFKMALAICKLHSALELLKPNTDWKEVGASEGDSKTATTESTTTVCIEYREESKGEDALLQSTNQTAEVTAGQGERSEVKSLREYQRELAADAFNGKNTIICAPTGCGKTVVAVAICENHLKASSDHGDQAKIVFMATKVDVYAQQLKLFKEHFLDTKVRITGVCGSMDCLSMKGIVESNDIVILTPQILENALHRGEIDSLATFSLLVLDECHNATGKHPYNNIMARYLDSKLSNNSTALPQVVGLTASVGIGSFKNLAEAESNICQLCANLDAMVITTVTQHRDELRSYVHTAEKEFHIAKSRLSNPFITIINNIMMRTEKLAETVHNIASLSGLRPTERGNQKYEQWIVDVQKRCRVLQFKDKQEESRVCRALGHYTEHLRKYNDALMINEDARTTDALESLELFFRRVRNASFDDTERELTGLYDAKREQLQCLTTGEQHENPKLAALKSILEEEYRSNDKTRTMLFVRTRALVEALKNWIEETDSLKFLKPKVLTGRSRMTLNSKQGVLESFKGSDESKILIATSVADEGIDIPQCNLVLLYDYVGNVVKMVQVRGRGRAEGSKCILITSRVAVVDKEKQNMEREKFVEKAISSLQASPTAMHAKLYAFQKEDKAMRDLSRSIPEKPRSLETCQLLCGLCKTPVCLSDDLRVLKESQHIVQDPSFMQKCITEPHLRPKSYDEIRKTGKIYCKKCKQDWGIMVSYKTIQALPVLKIKSFVVQNCITQKQDNFSTWTSVPFTMKPFDPTERSQETRE